MNTYRIYEDLRLTLGEEAAKSLAHTTDVRGGPQRGHED